MSQLVKTKRQANLKDFKRFGAFKVHVEQKNVIFNSFVCKLGSFWQACAFNLAHSCHKEPNLHTNSLNNIVLLLKKFKYHISSFLESIIY
jgi:hypothetical protein